MKFLTIFICLQVSCFDNCASQNLSGILNPALTLPQNYLNTLQSESLTPNTGCTYNGHCTNQFVEDAATLSSYMIESRYNTTLISNEAIIKSLTISLLNNFSLVITQSVCSSYASDNSSRRDTWQFKVDNIHMNMEIVDATPNALLSFLTKLLTNPGSFLQEVCDEPPSSANLGLPELPSLSGSCLTNLLTASTATSGVYSSNIKNVVFGSDITAHKDGTYTNNFAGVIDESALAFYGTKCSGGNGFNLICECILTDQIMRVVLIALVNTLSSCLVTSYVSENNGLDFFFCPYQ